MSSHKNIIFFVKDEKHPDVSKFKKVCLVEDGWRIVEVGCINCAGFYLADLQKVLIELEGIKW